MWYGTNKNRLFAIGSARILSCSEECVIVCVFWRFQLIRLMSAWKRSNPLFKYGMASCATTLLAGQSGFSAYLMNGSRWCAWLPVPCSQRLCQFNATGWILGYVPRNERESIIGRYNGNRRCCRILLTKPSTRYARPKCCGYANSSRYHGNQLGDW